MDDSVTQDWDPGQGGAANCTSYVGKQVLPKLGAQMVLAIDEADEAFETAVQGAFFKMLRVWDSNRKSPSLPAWSKLGIALVVSTEPGLFVKAKAGSPFNVSTPFELEEFTPSEVARLNADHPRPISDADAGRLYALTGGQPFLTRRALYLTASGDPEMTFEALHSRATEPDGPFSGHLLHLQHKLNSMPDLAREFLAALASGKCRDELAFERLRGLGLLKREGTRVAARCDLYPKYFPERLR